MSKNMQKDIFLANEADSWFERNSSLLTPDRDDIVTDALIQNEIQPTHVLEIGCANGYRLETLRRRYGASCCGIEPSAQAVEAGRSQFRDLALHTGSADHLPFADGLFDLVIFGFCFYLIDPVIHLRCVAEADRVLADGGHLAIFDFQSNYPYYNNYSHCSGVRSFKLDVSRYFLAHPAYSLIHRSLNVKKGAIADPDRREGVDLLLKNMSRAFPPNPFVGTAPAS